MGGSLIKMSDIKRDCGDNVFAPYDETLEIREIEDYELRFYFNPSRFDVDSNCIKPLMTHASLRAGISGSNLSRIEFGEIIVRFNPAISDKRDRDFVKTIFTDYFKTLKPVTL